jgi:chemotaxis methyl-accepting protein methylase/chemotaxis receptor (MCP) glutamine deamidase CheD
MKRICLNIGEIAVTREPAVLETILGSCVAVCLWDARKKIGGLNHFLVPSGLGREDRPNLYGITSIRSLIEQVFQLGAERSDLQARIFGGGSILKPLEDLFTIGAENVKIAREILAEFDIPVVNDFIGAECGIRISFNTFSGEVSVICFDHESGRRYEEIKEKPDAGEMEFRSVHAASFFSDQHQFSHLEQVCLASLLESKQSKRDLRIWDSGCATGEEAYSIAISIHKILSSCNSTETAHNFCGWNVKILATDSSNKALTTAINGRYGAEQLPEQMDNSAKAIYFLKGNGSYQGHVQVKQFLKQVVSFRRFNLNEPEYPFKKQFDIIFCRNGMKAFDNATKGNILYKLYRQLSASGYLYLGNADTVPDNSMFEPVSSNIYRKRLAGSD